MKKKISIVGFGYNVKKNILPTLKKCKKLKLDRIYIRQNINQPEYKKYKFENINKLRTVSKNSWFYVSTPLASHYLIVKKLVSLGANVICEKPLTNNYKLTRKLFDLSAKQKTRLVEVDMYRYHKLFLSFKKFINQYKKKINKIEFVFTIPHIDKKNFIYNKKKSGGALMNLGFYPVSSAIELFGYPKKIFSQIDYLKKNKKNGIDGSGSFSFSYQNIYCNGYWGLGLKYQNSAKVIFKNKTSYFFNMFFAKNSKVNCKILHLNQNNNFTRITKVGKDDQFLNMFNFYIFKKYKKNHKKLSLNTIKMLEKIKNKK